MSKNNNEFKISFEGLHLNEEQAKKIDAALHKAAMHEIAAMDLKGKPSITSRPYPIVWGYIFDVLLRAI